MASMFLDHVRLIQQDLEQTTTQQWHQHLATIAQLGGQLALLKDVSEPRLLSLGLLTLPTLRMTLYGTCNAPTPLQLVGRFLLELRTSPLCKTFPPKRSTSAYFKDQSKPTQGLSMVSCSRALSSWQLSST